jgi:RNA 2',3'-cyclic 3'-phosphodiesterase
MKAASGSPADQLPERIRAFVALRMSDGTETAIEQFIDSLRPLCDWVRWVSRANFHLTLRFLGNEAPLSQLETLAAGLAAIAGQTQPFSLTVQGVGGFPNLARPRVIWAGLRGDGLIKLAEDVGTAASRSGFSDEDRPYTPHLTIARVSDPKGLTQLRNILNGARQHQFGVSTITSMALYRSVLDSTGAKYVELKHWDLVHD